MPAVVGSLGGKGATAKAICLELDCGHELDCGQLSQKWLEIAAPTHEIDFAHQARGGGAGQSELISCTVTNSRSRRRRREASGVIGEGMAAVWGLQLSSQRDGVYVSRLI
jgi:hypothetical protein